MPKPGLFSPVNMGFGQAIKEKFDAKVWVDDLQLEFVPPPPGGVFAADRAYASPYRASDLDKGRLGPKERPRRPATIAVPKLPAGVKPSIALETWEKYAADAGEFFVQLEKPATVTKAFYACDDDNLYVGFRNFGEDSSLRSRPHGFKDASSICVRNSIEMLFSPTPDGRHYHYQYAVNEDRFDAFDEDKRWDGTWKSENRDVNGAVEYLLTLPFADFVENGITGQWTVNLIRNDRNAVRNQCPSTELSHSGASRDKPTWGVNEFGGRYMNPNAVSGTFSGYSFTATQATLDAINAVPAHVTEEVCAKAVTFATDMSFFGFRGAGGAFGARGDGSCNVYFNYRGASSSNVGTTKTQWCAGLVDVYSYDSGYLSRFVDAGLTRSYAAFAGGSTATRHCGG